MPQQRLLAINEAAMTVYRWRSGLLGVEAEFSADAAGLARWEEYVGRNRQAVFSVFAGLPEESLQREDIPYARGGDRRALIERKLAQRYPGSAWKFARSLGRSESGRRDERLLMASLNRPEAIEPWLAPLQRAEARLVGIYTAALLAEHLAAKLGGGAPSFLLVALVDGGLRQMFFERGQLRLSRCVPADIADVAATAGLCSEEAAKLLRYLLGQRLLGQDLALSVVVLLHPRDLPTFQAACSGEPQLRYGFADLTAVAARQGLRSPPEDSRCDTLFLHLMARRRAPAQYASPGLRRSHRLARIRSQLTVGTAALVIAAALSGSRDLAEGIHLRSEQGLLAAAIATARDDHQRARAALPAHQFDADALRLVVDRLDALRREEARLPESLARIGAALDRADGVELDRLDWREWDGAQAAAPDLRIELAARLPRVAGHDGEAQATALRDFSAKLVQATGMAVDTLQWPAAIDAGRGLVAADVERIAGETPRFVLRLGGGPR